ncbi:MAG: hypothetical protein R3246_12275, partial [Acidimicrobiia bacterium]|nr:hypothetical protein [Acidimicrobiia bacterium]
MTVRAVRNGGEPSEVRGARPVMIRDRNGADLPYSKGLMATSMMAAGLGPELAYRTAAQVQDRVRRMAAKRITTGVLCTVASQVLENEFGPEVAENYLAWRR